MTITVTIMLPENWVENDAEISQWVKDQTRHSPSHYVTKSAETTRPRMLISRPDGSEDSYRLTSGGNWIPDSEWRG